MTNSVFTNLLLPLTTPEAWREKLEIEDVTLTTLGVSSFWQGILDETTATAALGGLGIVASTFTPTLTNTTNLDASTAYPTAYARIGATVIVAGRVDADPTAVGGVVMGMSLPVASAFAGSENGGGVAYGNVTVRVLADGANDRMTLEWTATSTANAAFGFIFGYRVI